MRVRNLDRSFIFSQVDLAIKQLHAIGIAHCDICVDNVFVDSLADGGAVFLGDLEYCRSTKSPPPVGVKRAHNVATAEALDLAQLEVFRDELAFL
jgi:tRNA A-37 threonylcarbamoyl transferase component Bud32